MRLTLEDVRRALAAPRPGLTAQLRMAPRPAPPPLQEFPPKEAGVLVLLYLQSGELYFVLTRRADTVAMHKGQISLPGGEREGAERLEETARREVSEELGLEAACIEILGDPLTPLYIPASGFWVTPFVGFWPGQPIFQLEREEVIELIETPLATLLDDSVVQEEEWQLRGRVARVPFFQIQGHKVWGATAMMLSEFAALLRDGRS